MASKIADDACSSDSSPETVARHQDKRARGVSSADTETEVASVQIVRRDDDYGTPPDSKPQPTSQSDASAVAAENPVIRSFRELGGDGDDFKGPGDGKNEEDEEEDGRKLFFPGSNEDTDEVAEEKDTDDSPGYGFFRKDIAQDLEDEGLPDEVAEEKDADDSTGPENDRVISDRALYKELVKTFHDRGEKIELLVDKTENLPSQAQDFGQQIVLVMLRARILAWWFRCYVSLPQLSAPEDTPPKCPPAPRPDYEWECALDRWRDPDYPGAGGDPHEFGHHAYITRRTADGQDHFIGSALPDICETFGSLHEVVHWRMRMHGLWDPDAYEVLYYHDPHRHDGRVGLLLPVHHAGPLWESLRSTISGIWVVDRGAPISEWVIADD